MADPAPLLIEHLTYRYRESVLALDDVCLSIPAGECVAVIGPNGAGKSTLLLHLNGLLRGGGRVSVDGIELRRDTLASIRRLVGLVFQDPDDQLFLPTCLEDVAFGPLNEGSTWQEAEQRAMEALAAVGMDQHAGRPPHQLSIGQRKRVALATVLSMRPSLIAFDEPSAGLDPAARRQFIAIVCGLPQTRIIATHDLALAEETCARTVLMDDGRVIADGPTATILSDTPLLLQHRLEPPGYRPPL
jgi:cobalt/nickel transport system ATP-binding protein